MTGALIFKIIVVLLLFAVLISLTSGMFFLVHDKGDSDRTVKSLTARITLSVALFLMLITGYFTGLIQPHGISPETPETEKALPK
jgi:F0F1-type ATP synthase membrane subunit a